MNWISIVALIMIFLGGIGAILLTIGQTKDSAKDKQDLIDLTKAENVELKTRLQELQDERKSLKADLEIRDKRIDTQTNNIIELNEQLVEKSDYITNYLTGGKGFPIVVINTIKSTNPKDDEKITFTLKNETDLPLYDVTAIIFDWNYIKAKLSNSEHPNKPYLKKEVLQKSLIQRFDQSQMSEDSDVITAEEFNMKDGLLYIKLKCRSSFVHEKMAFVTEGKIIYYGFLIHDKDGKILKEWIDPGATESAKKAIRKKFDLIPNKVVFTLTN